MNFERGKHRDEPEINLIAMIDVLLVILIFLMVTTTFAHRAELKINLPTADAQKPMQRSATLNVAVDALGNYSVNGAVLESKTVGALARALQRAADGEDDPVVVINADADAKHQAVVSVMEAARVANYTHLTFATQTQPR
ncbi:MAG: ExbD/TolR family protein [Burkholderiales bacterium]